MVRCRIRRSCEEGLVVREAEVLQRCEHVIDRPTHDDVCHATPQQYRTSHESDGVRTELNSWHAMELRSSL